MDELLIGDQKYISSKRASEITGYAKDYIGQLCREGRVEARLVGRSWYVREAAIRDHRFGLENASPEPVKREVVDDNRAQTKWDSPKYEADVVPEIRLVSNNEQEYSEEIQVSRHDEILDLASNVQVVDTASKMQEAWQAWFSQNKSDQTPEEPVMIENMPQEQEFEPQVEVFKAEIEIEEEEVPIQITRVEEPYVPNEPISEERQIRHIQYEPKEARRSYLVLKAGLFSIVILTVIVTSLGTGLLKIEGRGLSASVIEIISGIRIYSI